MGLYTRSGDAGETRLADGTRVSKHDVRVEAYGCVDEAISAIGQARAAVGDESLDSVLAFAQQRLFNCASLLAAAESVAAPSAADIAFVEQATDAFMAASPEMRGFVLPAGGEKAARLHVARTAVRRAERRVAALAAEEDVDPAVLAFINRLSDMLFAAARYANRVDDVREETWNSQAQPPTL